MTNPNDLVREAILRKLYETHKSAKSPRSAGIGIRDLQASLRPDGFKQQEVASNLDYLIQKRWAVEVVEDRSFVTARGTTQPSQKLTYKISDVGIDKVEGASTYERPGVSGINITTISGVTVVGDGNVVNAAFAPAAAALGELRRTLLNAENLAHEHKLNAAADIDSLQGQLQKPHPSVEVVKSLWKSVETIAITGGFVQAAAQVGQLLGPLLN